MQPENKSRWIELAASYAVLLILLAIPAVPAYYFVEASHKLLVIRACGGIILAFTLRVLVKALRERIEWQPPSAFDAGVTGMQSGLAGLAATMLAAAFTHLWTRPLPLYMVALVSACVAIGAGIGAVRSWKL